MVSTYSVSLWHGVQVFLEICRRLCQVLEFAGVPELGVLAPPVHRSGRRVFEDTQQPSDEHKANNSKDHMWLRQNPPPTSDCGDSVVIQNVVADSFMHHWQSQSLSILYRQRVMFPSCCNFGRLTSTRRIMTAGLSLLNLYLQLLLVKLAYVTIPALAAEAVVHLKFDNPRALADDFKSHWAYYVMIRALVLGQRIKPQRRLLLRNTYHVPVWDLLWNKDRRLDRKVAVSQHSRRFRRDEYSGQRLGVVE
jgi:hypothetical protein